MFVAMLQDRQSSRYLAVDCVAATAEDVLAYLRWIGDHPSAILEPRTGCWEVAHPRNPDLCYEVREAPDVTDRPAPAYRAAKGLDAAPYGTPAETPPPPASFPEAEEIPSAALQEARLLESTSRGQWNLTTHDGGMLRLRHQGGAYVFYKGGAGADLPYARLWSAFGLDGEPLKAGGRVRTFGTAGKAIEALQEARLAPVQRWDTPAAAAA